MKKKKKRPVTKLIRSAVRGIKRPKDNWGK